MLKRVSKKILIIKNLVLYPEYQSTSHNQKTYVKDVLFFLTIQLLSPWLSRSLDVPCRN